MKYLNSFKTLFLSLLFLLLTCHLFCQTKYQKIEMFIKMWGFLKYHDPAVASGKFDWDSVYIRNLPLIEQTITKDEFNKQLLSIINNLGALQKKLPARLPDSLFTANHDLSWIKQSKFLNAELESKLMDIYQHRNQEENKYIKSIHSTVDFSGEKQYEAMTFPNLRYRLLFLSRFWNVINYFAPYKYLVEENWNNVLLRFIPKIINAKDTLMYYRTLLQLAASLNDGHAQLWFGNANAPISDLVFGKYTAPFYAEIINGAVIIRKLANDTLCRKADIEKGDIILAIDKEPVVAKINFLKPYVSASNIKSKEHYIARNLFDTHNSYLKLKIKRGNEIFTKKVKCILTAEKNWGDISNYTHNETGYKTVGNSIAYIYAMQIWKGNIDTIKALIKSRKAVIFDVRNYPNNGDVFYNIFDIMLTEPKIINLSSYFLTANPGYFEWKKSAMIGNFGNKVISPYKGRVIILVDERTQSQGEYSAMALQTIPNSVTIGSQTAGADGNVTLIPMGSKLSLSYSGYGIYYPDKTITQRQGIKIDITAKKTLESVAHDQDVISEKALKYLKAGGID